MDLDFLESYPLQIGHLWSFCFLHNEDSPSRCLFKNSEASPGRRQRGLSAARGAVSLPMNGLPWPPTLNFYGSL